MSYKKIFLKNFQYLSKEKLIFGKRWTKKDIEEICGVSEGYIGREGAKYTIELLIKLSELFEVSIDELIGSDLERQGINSKKISKFLDKLIEDTDRNYIEWDIRNNLASILDLSDNPFDYYEEGERKLYKRTFQEDSFHEGEVIGKVYIGECKQGGYLIIFKSKVRDVEGWEIYKYSQEMDKPLGIYHTFSDNDNILVHKIYDLLLAMEIRKRDLYIDKYAKEEMRMYLAGEQREVQTSFISFSSDPDSESD